VGRGSRLADRREQPGLDGLEVGPSPAASHVVGCFNSRLFIAIDPSMAIPSVDAKRLQIVTAVS
jgi:hypothetical protein